MKDCRSKNLIITFMTFLILAAFFIVPMSISAYEIPKFIRVGLETSYSNLRQIHLNNDDIHIGYAEPNGDFIHLDTFNSTNGFDVHISNENFKMINVNFNNYKEANEYKEMLISYNYEAYVCFVDNYLTVYIKSDEHIDNTVSVLLDNGAIIEISNEDEIKILSHNSNLQIKSADDVGTINLGMDKYRGRIEFLQKGSSFTLINVLDFDHYLYGVVPAEMPVSFHLEALKAQSVAARTYAFKKIGLHLHDESYHVCDSTHCQVYRGFNFEDEKTNEAVDSTSGIIISYDGEPIDAVYFASSGGHTENSEDVWIEEVPYLKGVSDLIEENTDVWIRTFTLKEINDLAVTNNLNIGYISNVVINEKSEFGRVSELKFIGEYGEKIITKDKIRTFFSSKGGALKSTNFNISKVNGYSDNVPVFGGGTVVSSNSSNNEQSENHVFGGGSVVSSNKEPSNNPVFGGSTNDYDKEENALVTTPNVEDEKLKEELLENNLNEFEDKHNNLLDDLSIKDYETTFIISGVGYGHGVGMSQRGAAGLALAGYDYEYILNHYYTEISLTNVNEQNSDEENVNEHNFGEQTVAEETTDEYNFGERSLVEDDLEKEDATDEDATNEDATNEDATDKDATDEDLAEEYSTDDDFTDEDSTNEDFAEEDLEEDIIYNISE